MIPPKPALSSGRSTLFKLIGRFRHDLLSALPAHLYRAWMADNRSPLLRSVLCNDPALVQLVLSGRPGDFPKSRRLREGLAPLLGESVFVTNGAQWARQRRIIDPAFEGGRLRESLPAMWDAALVARARLQALAGREIDVEPEASHAAADIIFRALFSLPIEHRLAARVFAAFRAHQEAQPLVNPGALLLLPSWVPRLHSRRTRRTAAEIRGLIGALVNARAEAIARDEAPDDLATKIMTARDPLSGATFTAAEMVDQVAIFFLAGHETSASALAWSLWLLAAAPDWQDAVAAEARAALCPASRPDLSALQGLKLARAVFREALRLYPPVPMMVRECARPEQFRSRNLPAGTQVVISPWHLHRHERLWDRPDAFDPGRWDEPEGRASARQAYIPFGAGQRVCPGAGFAMVEGPLLIALICRDLRLSRGAVDPVPVARLTVRGRDGIRLRIDPRAP